MNRTLQSLAIVVSFCYSTSFAQKRDTDSLLAIINKKKHDSTEVRVLNSLAGETAKANSAKAMQYYWQAIKVAESYLKGPWAGTSFFKLALLHSQSGNLDSARIYIEKGRKIASAYPLDNNLQYNLYNVSGIYNKNAGQCEEALKNYEQIDKLPEGSVNKEDVAGNYLNISNVYTRMGKSLPSQQYLFKALAIFEQIHNETGLAFCYNGLGNQFYKEKQYGKAEVYLRKSIELKEKAGNKKAVAVGLNGLAVLYMDLKEYDKALEYVNRSILLAQEVGIKDPLATAYINKGMIYAKQNKLREAEDAYLKGKAAAAEMKNESLLSAVNSELGKLFQERSEMTKALASFKQGIEQARKSKSLDAEENAHELLAEFYFKNGQYKEAYEEYRLYHQLFNEVEGGVLKLKIYDLETKYETEKKEGQIKLLQKDAQLQASLLRQQRLLATALIFAIILIIMISFLLLNRYRIIHKATRQLELERMRNNIARDLHDDIGSTLSSINIISQLALKENKLNESSQYLKKIGDQSAKMMESLSDIVWSINSSDDSLEKMIIRMKEFSSEMLEPRNISYEFKGINALNGTQLNVEERKNIFLIFKETINNAAKYSHSNLVTIELLGKDHNFSLIITDNGKGFDLQHVKLGNGLKNIQTRASEINADLHIDAAEGKGTRITLDLTHTK